MPKNKVFGQAAGGVAEDNGSQLHRAARCAIALKWLKDETE